METSKKEIKQLTSDEALEIVNREWRRVYGKDFDLGVNVKNKDLRYNLGEQERVYYPLLHWDILLDNDVYAVYNFLSFNALGRYGTIYWQKCVEIEERKKTEKKKEITPKTIKTIYSNKNNTSKSEKIDKETRPITEVETIKKNKNAVATKIETTDEIKRSVDTNIKTDKEKKLNQIIRKLSFDNQSLKESKKFDELNTTNNITTDNSDKKKTSHNNYEITMEQ